MNKMHKVNLIQDNDMKIERGSIFQCSAGEFWQLNVAGNMCYQLNCIDTGKAWFNLSGDLEKIIKEIKAEKQLILLPPGSKIEIEIG